jgi:site-specific recombinase XerD
LDDEGISAARTPGSKTGSGSNSSRLPRSLKLEERRRLLAQPSHKYPTGVRNRALMAAMLYAGLRSPRRWRFARATSTSPAI